MFSSGVIAATFPIDDGSSTYTGQLQVRSATDKFGTRYGFSANPNTTPPWGQQGTGTASILQYGNLDTVTVNLGGTNYQIVSASNFVFSQSLILLHPDQTSTTALPADLFTTISTNLGTLNASDVTSRAYSAIGNNSYKVTTYFWTTQGTTVFTNIFGTTDTTRTLTITE